jgi:hypothetical protein
VRVSVKISVKAQRVPSIYCIECRRACLTIYSYKKLKGVDQAGNLVSSKSQFHTQAVISEIRGLMLVIRGYQPYNTSNLFSDCII